MYKIDSFRKRQIMSVIKFLLYAVISFSCSALFFNSSTVAVIFIFLGLNCISVTSKEEFMKLKKKTMLQYGLLILGCLVGILLIIVGKNVVYKDGIIILGAILFAPTASVLVIHGVCNLIGYLMKKVQTKE